MPGRMSRLFSISSAIVLLGGLAQAQTVDFDLRTFPDSPVVFADSSRMPVPVYPWRQFVTIRDESKKSVVAVIFEQSVSNGSKTEIVALERVVIVFPGGEKRRVSVAVKDMFEKLQSGVQLGRPVLSVVAVEFLDGSQWTAPTGLDLRR